MSQGFFRERVRCYSVVQPVHAIDMGSGAKPKKSSLGRDRRQPCLKLRHPQRHLPASLICSFTSIELSKISNQAI